MFFFPFGGNKFGLPSHNSLLSESKVNLYFFPSSSEPVADIVLGIARTYQTKGAG